MNKVIMKSKLLMISSVIVMSMTVSSCATIFSGTTQTVSFDSFPPGAEVVTIRKNGNEQKIGLTPCTVPISKKTKSVKFVKNDFYDETYPISQDAKINVWYYVDLVGIISAGIGIPSTIVDLSTGAYIKLPSQVKVELKKK
jgi:hypothetical protein